MIFCVTIEIKKYFLRNKNHPTVGMGNLFMWHFLRLLDWEALFDIVKVFSFHIFGSVFWNNIHTEINVQRNPQKFFAPTRVAAAFVSAPHFSETTTSYFYHRLIPDLFACRLITWRNKFLSKLPCSHTCIGLFSLFEHIQLGCWWNPRSNKKPGVFELSWSTNFYFFKA